MERLYFAYGSNMDPARLRARLGRAPALGAARLDDHQLAFDKRGRDGSAKANLVARPGGVVWGVVYELEAAAWAALDRCEGGYERAVVQVELAAAAERMLVQTYVSQQRCPDAAPFGWYLDHCVVGARHHGLPEAYVARLEALRARADRA